MISSPLYKYNYCGILTCINHLLKLTKMVREASVRLQFIYDSFQIGNSRKSLLNRL